MSIGPDIEAHLERLPKPIVDKLRLLLGRLRRIIVLRGSLAVAAVAVGSLLSIMAVDAMFLIYWGWVRWALTLVGLAATLAAAWRFLGRPLSKRFTLTAVARLIEIRHPELEERISSSVELLAQDMPEDMRGSRKLIDALVREAVVEAESVEPSQEFSKRSVLPYLAASAAAGGILAALLVVWPQQVTRLLARAVAPYADVGNLNADELRVEPGDVRLAEGDPVAVHVAFTGKRATRAELRRVTASGQEVVERMTRRPDEADHVSRFLQEFPVLTESFRYRVRVGRALSRYYTIEVIRKPAFLSLGARCDYPPYTGMAAVSITNGLGDLEAPIGTRLTFMARFNKPMALAELAINRAVVAAQPPMAGKPESGAWPLTLRAIHTGPWSVRLRDEYGFESAPIEHKLSAVADRPPTVQLTSPDTTELKMKPTDLLRLGYIVRDDYGVAGGDLMVGLDADELKPLSRSEVRRLEDKRGLWAGASDLDLSQLNVGKARSVRVAIRATDNLPADMNGPQTGMSAVITIQLDLTVKSLAQQSIEAQSKEIRKALAAVQERLEKAQSEAVDKPAKLAKAEPLSREDQAQIEDIRHQTATAEKSMKDLTDQVKETAFDKMAEKVDKVRKDDVTPAREAAEEIPLADKPQDRAAKAEEMKKDLDRAVADVKDLLKELDKTQKDVEALAKLEDLAREQDRLADQAQKAAEKNEPNTDEWKQREDKMGDEVAQMMAKDETAKAEQLRADAEQARELAKDAADLAKDQERARDAFKDAQAPAKAEDLKDAIQQELARQEQDIARDTAAMQKEAKEQGQETPQAMEEARKDTAEAAEKLRGDEPQEAAQPAAEARDELKATAEKMQQEAGAHEAEAGKPEADAAGQMEKAEEARETANEAGNLAKRQEQVAKGIEALAKGDLKEAMAAVERGMAEEAREMASEMGEMRKEGEQMQAPPEGLNEAMTASQQMERGEAKAREAASLAPKSSEPPQAQAMNQAETEAAQAMKQASEAMNRMSEQYAKAASQLAPQGQEPAMDPERMQAAREQAEAAAKASQPHQAAAEARAAAQNLEKAAKQASEKMGMPLEKARSLAQSTEPPDPNALVTDPEGGRKGAVPESVMPKIFELLGISKADWLRIRGQLKSEVGGGSEANGPAEYRELIRKYFEEVARQGAQEK